MRRLIVGISGATGAIYGIRLLEMLRNARDVEVHLVMSEAAALTIEEETDWSTQEDRALADHTYDIGDVGAAIASGSFQTMGMVIAPCSIKSMSMISNSIDANLLIRSADVVLKERRKLVLLVREAPLHLGHLRLMAHLAEIGGIIHPPVPAFYSKPRSLDDIINHTVGRVLDQFGIDNQLVARWAGTSIGKSKRADVELKRLRR